MASQQASEDSKASKADEVFVVGKSKNIFEAINESVSKLLKGGFCDPKFDVTKAFASKEVADSAVKKEASLETSPTEETDDDSSCSTEEASASNKNAPSSPQKEVENEATVAKEVPVSDAAVKEVVDAAPAEEEVQKEEPTKERSLALEEEITVVDSEPITVDDKKAASTFVPLVLGVLIFVCLTAFLNQDFGSEQVGKMAPLPKLEQMNIEEKVSAPVEERIVVDQEEEL